jgi:hypothetical protein
MSRRRTEAGSQPQRPTPPGPRAALTAESRSGKISKIAVTSAHRLLAPTASYPPTVSERGPRIEVRRGPLPKGRAFDPSLFKRWVTSWGPNYVAGRFETRDASSTPGCGRQDLKDRHETGLASAPAPSRRTARCNFAIARTAILATRASPGLQPEVSSAGGSHECGGF